MKVGHRAKVWPSGEDCARRTTSTSGARCQGKDATSMTSSVFPNSFMMSVTVTTVQVSRKFREVRTTCSGHTAAVVVELSKVSQKNRATGRQWYREGGGLPNRMFAEGIEFTGSHQLPGLLGILFFFNYRKYHIDIH